MPGFTTEFETGLLDDFDFTIEEAYFAPDAKYNNGDTTLLKWEGKTDNLDVPETHVWFPLGKGWTSKDGGKTVVHESGKDGKYYVRNSLMAKLIARCIEEFGMEDLLNERGNPFTAEVWKGMRFHLKSEVVDYGAGGNIDAKAKILPNAYLGLAEDGAVEQTKPAKASGGSSAADKIAAAKAKAAAAKSGGSLKDKVIETLKAHDDFSTAQNAALEIDGVTDDDDLLAQLMDESGLWSEVNA